MSSPSLWRLAPWRRAPLLALGSPATVVAVVVTTAVLACAVVSAPLFLSSARSAALQAQLSPQCAEAAWPATAVTLQFPPGTTPAVVADDVQRGQRWPGLDRPAEPVLSVTRSIGAAGNPQAGMPVLDPTGTPMTQPATLLWRPDAIGQVDVVESGDAPGVWVPASFAAAARSGVGDVLTVAGSPVPVAGVYTDLFDTDPGSYWCDYAELYLNPGSANVPPPALLLATDEATLATIGSAAGFVTVQQQVPVERAELTVDEASDLVAEQQAVLRALPDPASGALVDQGWNGRLDQAVERARLLGSGLRGPVVAVAAAAALLALVLVAASGGFWADRRHAEVRLLAARGAGPLPLGGKAALELAGPALAGTAVGWLVGRVLVAALGPADDLDRAAVTRAAVAAAATFVIGLGSAALAAGARAGGTVERSLGARPRWPAVVPWEVVLIAVAGLAWLDLRSGEAIVVEGAVAQVNGLLVAFPVLAVAGAAVLLARLGTRLLPGLRRWGGRRGPAVFFTVNRLAATPLASAALLVAVTLPVAVLGYTATLAASSGTTLAAKAGVQIGAARALVSVDPVRRDGTGGVGAVVDRYEGSVGPLPGGDAVRTDVQILGVDPQTFARTAFWDESFADVPLAELVAPLAGPDVDGRIPVVATDLPLGPVDLRVGSQPVAAQVVGTARVLPGRRTVDPVVLLAAGRLPEIPAAAGSDRQSELWTNGSLGPALDALVAGGGRLTRTVAPADVLSAANLLAVPWTFGYLSALAVFVGVIAAAGLLLHLESRGRAQVPGYVLARRMGLSRAGHLRSLVAELVAVAVAGLVLGALLAAGAVAVVHRRLDVDLLRPPTPLLHVPWPAVAGTVVATLAVAALAGRYAQRTADRADPTSVLREAA